MVQRDKDAWPCLMLLPDCYGYRGWRIKAGCLAQVLDSCLDAIILKSDNSALAKDCRKEIKAANARILKLGRKVPSVPVLRLVHTAGFIIKCPCLCID
jgi:hypothetical protein